MHTKHLKLLSSLLFGEGKKETNFLKKLTELEKFIFHTKGWSPPIIDNASGSCAEEVLKKCKRRMANLSFDLVICFLDLDKLKEEFGVNWKQEANQLEKKYPEINIIWQINNLEDELQSVLKLETKSKHKINAEAKRSAAKFINSHFWLKIIGYYKSVLDKNK